MQNNDPLPDITGGVYQPADAMREISARFALVDRAGEVNVVHRDRRGNDNTLAKGSFEQYLGNVFVEIEVGEDTKRLPAARWWRAAPDRPPIRVAVFAPHAAPRADEYNFWRGFGVTPVEGVGMIHSLMRHIFLVACKRDWAKYRYMTRWMAWKVQNPEKQAEVSIVLQSEGEGSGKSTVSEALRVIFGTHAAVISDPQQIIGAHNEHLEFVCFVQAEEALFAGDPRVADRIKQTITGNALHINPKFRKAYDSPNHIGMMLTTNHGWAVPAGKGARRWFVLKVDECKVDDTAWFNKIYADLAAGGYGQLLRALQNKKLGDWHPRQLPRTIELAEQQIRSASFLHQWLLTSASDGVIAVYEKGERKSWGGLELGEAHKNSDLHDAYIGAAKAEGQRVEGRDAFGRSLKKILGEKNRAKHVMEDGKDQGRGWFIPGPAELITLVEKSLGISEGALADMETEKDDD